MFVPAFKARTNPCITHSKWGHFFTHLWTSRHVQREDNALIPLHPYYGRGEDSALSQKARTEIFDLALSKCPHFECKKLILVLALNAGPNTRRQAGRQARLAGWPTGRQTDEQIQKWNLPIKLIDNTVVHWQIKHKSGCIFKIFKTHATREKR